MKSAEEVSLKEGFRELRRRLPSLNRAYHRQRFARWVARALIMVGLLTTGPSIFLLFRLNERRPAPTTSPVSVGFDGSINGEMKRNSNEREAETAPDGVSRVELSAGRAHN